jgi:hypothetical protein
MLLCFGAAWPVNIAKSWRTRSAAGKSWGFLVIIIIGYLGGITHKLLYSRDIGLVLYLINLIMVGLDLLIYVRNRALDRQRASAG